MIDFESLQDKANKIRRMVIEMVTEAGSGHMGGPLGSADFWTALYFGGVLNYKAGEPEWEGRDRVILSAGHYCPVVYAVLAEAGFFEKKELSSLRKLGSRLQGHPHFEWKGKRNLPGMESTSGPLGQGVSVAVGMAWALRMDEKKSRVVCFMGDGEQNEGQVWEAYMLAGKESLSNLTLVIDRNNIQIDGHTEEVMPLEPLADKLAAFNLEVRSVDGHDIGKIVGALQCPSNKTMAIILNTIPGKGISFMENKPEWHGRAPNEEEARRALRELGGIELSRNRNFKSACPLN